MRKGHWLRGNTYTRIPENHVCVATVGRPVPGRPLDLEFAASALVLGRFAAGQWKTLERLWAPNVLQAQAQLFAACAPAGKTWVWLLKPCQDLPLLQFTSLVERGQFKRHYWVWGDPPVVLDGALFGRAVKIIGLANWLDVDEQELDAMLPHPQQTFCASLGFAQTAEETAQRYADNLARAVEQILRLVYVQDLGHLRATVGGQSMQSYRHSHMPGKIGIHNNPAALELERDAPMGTPVECRVKGRVPWPISILDVNGLYPHVMGQYPYPAKLLWHSSSPTFDVVRRQAETRLIIGRCTVKGKCAPYLEKHDDGCRWDGGEGSVVLVGPDFDQCLATDDIVQVHEAAAYEGAPLFTEWSQNYFDVRAELRKSNNRVQLKVWKSIGVSLWGAFAARLFRYIPYDFPGEHPQWGHFAHHPVGSDEVYECRAIAGIVDRLECREEPDDSMPAISAFVACYARRYVAGLEAFAGRNNTVYKVADAIHVNSTGRARLETAGLVDDTRPGAFKVALNARQIVYRGPNCFFHDDTLTMAGKQRRAVEVRPGTFEWAEPARLGTSVVRPPTGTVALEPRQVSLPSR